MSLRFACWLRRCLVLAPALFPATALADPKVDTRDHVEVDIVPIAGGDSDIGVGGGAYGALVQHKRGFGPYRWRLETGSFFTFKPPAEGAVRTPYQDAYLKLIVPDLVPKILRLEIRPSFTREDALKYYGVGNGSLIAPGTEPNDEVYKYQRIHPTLQVRVRLTLGARAFLMVGNSYTHNWLEVPKAGRVRDDEAALEPARHGGIDAASHGVDIFEYALVYDDRDDETSTHRGQYHQVKLRLSPGGTAALPYRYGQTNVTLRAFVTPIREYLTIAARAVGDIQFGDVPFYELPRYEDTFAIGGGNGVRGVPAQRYYGKIKAFGNLEARSDFVPFRLFKKKFVLGAVAFFDAGRVWSDFSPDPRLGNDGGGLKYGVGGGLRLHQGETFVVRLDVAWSPDARPVGAYFGAGEVF
jgi:hypothetical protein